MTSQSITRSIYTKKLLDTCYHNGYHSEKPGAMPFTLFFHFCVLLVYVVVIRSLGLSACCVTSCVTISFDAKCFHWTPTCEKNLEIGLGLHHVFNCLSNDESPISRISITSPIPGLVS